MLKIFIDLRMVEAGSRISYLHDIFVPWGPSYKTCTATEISVQGALARKGGHEVTCIPQPR